MGYQGTVNESKPRVQKWSYEISRENLAACVESLDFLPSDETRSLSERIRKDSFSKVVSQCDGWNFTEIVLSSEPTTGVSREDVFSGRGIASFVGELPYIGEYPITYSFARDRDFPNSIRPSPRD